MANCTISRFFIVFHGLKWTRTTKTSHIFNTLRLVNASNLGSRSYSNGSSEQKQKLTFEEYRKSRRSLKWRSRISGIPMAFLAMAASSAINIHMNPYMFDPPPEMEIQTILGMDPIIFAALCGAVSGIAGFVAGGAIFSVSWKLVFPKTAKQLQEREKDFLARLHHHRYSLFDQSKYEDDYYAEKVLTLSDYRQWVRHQHQKKENDINRAKKSNEQTSDKSNL